MRFSADKSPYHARLHLLLSTGPEFNKVPGVHLVISATRSGCGAGHYGFSPQKMARMRAAICDAGSQGELLGLLDGAVRQGAILTPSDFAKLSTELPAGEAWDHLLRRKHLVARTPEHLPCPDWLFTEARVPGLVAIVADLAPLSDWCTRFA